MELIISGLALEMLVSAADKCSKARDSFGAMSVESDHANESLAFIVEAILKTNGLKK